MATALLNYMYNSSVKFFDNRENENEESYYSTLASEITTFTQQQLNIAGSGTTNIGNVYANNEDQDVGAVTAENIETTGDVSFSGSSSNFGVGWNSSTNILSVNGILSVSNSTTIGGNLSVSGQATIDDLIVKNTFTLGNQLNEFTILEANDDDNLKQMMISSRRCCEADDDNVEQIMMLI